MILTHTYCALPFVHCLYTINLPQLFSGICLQAGLLNMTLLILKLSLHLFMPGLGNPFAILMGRQMDLHLLQRRASASCCRHQSCLHWEGAWSSIPWSSIQCWGFLALMNSQGHLIYLAVLLGKLLLSWLRKQAACPIVRNISVLTSKAACDHGTYI